MKIKSILIFMVLAVSLASCKKWLDVQPDTEKDRDGLINSVNGFQQMLIGVYSGMVDQSLYGHQLNYGFIESVAYNHYFTNSSEGPFINWNYTQTTTRPIIDDVWTKMYNVIANDNSILKSIDDKRSLFTDKEYRVMKGEALALRAFLHFDLLRLFAPAYTLDNSKVSMPYVDDYVSTRFPHLTSKAVMDKILTDLNVAEALLKDIDPIFTIGLTNTASSNGDFYTNRQYRFNYWAVQALKARIYLYAGNKALALEQATKVINSGVFKAVDPSAFVGTNKDVVFMPELIFALNAINLPDYYVSYFASGKYRIGDGPTSYAGKIFDDFNDYRYLYQLTEDSYGNKTISAKYKQTTKENTPIKKQTIPMLRLGEMYLIAAEGKLSTGDNSGAIALLRELRGKRGYLSSDKGISDAASASDIQKIIVQEMRKETFMEGQTFFCYKRLNQTTIPAFISWFGMPATVGPVKFVLPIPESEKEFGLFP